MVIFPYQYGKTPFRGRTREHTFDHILHKTNIKFPETPAVRFAAIALLTHLSESLTFLSSPYAGDDLEQTSKEAKSLVKKLLDKDPRKRLGSEHGAADIKVLLPPLCPLPAALTPSEQCEPNLTQR
jgi:serine/threonine protein kinase